MKKLNKNQSGRSLRTAGLRFVLSGALVNLILTASAGPPTIQNQPKDQVAVLYQSAAFDVIASGTGPLSYEWRKNGMTISGATNSGIVLAHSQFGDAGIYSVVVSNLEGNATSRNAALTVTPPKAGDVDGSFTADGIGIDWIHAMAIQPDGKVLIGGSYAPGEPGGFYSRGLTRLNANGTRDYLFTSYKISDRNAITAIFQQRDGKIVFGGEPSFCRACDGGSVPGFLDRLNSDGTSDTNFMGGGDDGIYSVTASVAQPDGKFIVIGTFDTDGGGSLTNKIVRLNPDGGLDHGFRAVVVGSIDEYVDCLGLQNDGKVIIGGFFTSVSGVRRNGIARLNEDGTPDTGFLNGLTGVGGGSYPTVYRIAVQPDGKIIIAGIFTTVNGVDRTNIARLNVDGTLDSAFLTQFSRSNDFVSSIALQSDGKLLIGGSFTNVNGASRNSVARLNTDGTLDTEFLTGLSGGNDSVTSIALQSDGKVLIGGSFTNYNGVSAPSIVRVWGTRDIPPQINGIDRSGSNTILTWGALPQRIYRVQYKNRMDSFLWNDLAGDVVGSSVGTASKTDSNSDLAADRFYRAILLPQKPMSVLTGESRVLE